MSVLRRWINLFRREQVDREIDEEFEAHLADAVEAGRDPAEARRALGSALQYREESRDLRLLPRVESLLRDAVFGWRQLKRHPAASAAAILSLALAIGSATAAFRLVDALLLRPLPIAEPQRLSVVAIRFTTRDGHADERDEFNYADFRDFRQALAGRADVLAIGPMQSREDTVITPSAGRERVYRQYFSGGVFGIFGLRPALGRLLTPDDEAPGAPPVVVLSYHFWIRRFGRDPGVVGKSFLLRQEAGGPVDRMEIVGVAPEGFTGTEPGREGEVFLPAGERNLVRVWVRPVPGVPLEQVRQPLNALFTRTLARRVRDENLGAPKAEIERQLRQSLYLAPAAGGVSRIQQEYRRPLLILCVLVALVLLLACANAGNLLTAQAAARAREMALRVSIGAGRWRLIQLVLVESAMLAAIASALGVLFAWWAAPLVVPLMHVPADRIILVFDAGWRQAAFSLSLAFLVTLLFGLAPALRASSIQPMSAIRGGQDPHARRRLMNVLLAAQMAFCVLVQFVAGLFVATFERLSHRPLGFSYEHVLVAYVEHKGPDLSADAWQAVARRMEAIPGVQTASVAGWPLLEQDRWNRTIRFAGHAVEARQPNCLDVSPGFFDTMRIGWIGGRDFRPGDAPPRFDAQAGALGGVGIVNEAFARAFFGGRDPVGRSVEVLVDRGAFASMQVVGYVRDAAYASLRDPLLPTIYIPQEGHSNITLLLRTAGDPMALAQALRRELLAARADLDVHQIQPESGFVVWGLVRERLLAALSAFFAMVALVLAAIGLYGVLNYAVTERRREIGIRMAIGARSAQVLWPVAAGAAAMVALGAVLGIFAGVASGRIFGSLLYEVTPTDASAVALPLAILLASAAAAALPPAIRAARIDPARVLRSE